MEQKLPMWAIKLSSKVYQVILADVLFVITNLPLVFSLFFIPITGQTALSFVALSVTVFPSLVAMNYAFWLPIEPLSEWNIWRRFWRSYRLNWKLSWVTSLIVTVVFLVLTFDFQYLSANNYSMILRIVLLLGMLFIFTVVLNMATVASRYELPIKHTARNALFLVMKYLPRQISMSLVVIVGLALTKFSNWAILVLLIWGLLSIFVTGSTKQILSKSALAAEQEEEK